MVKIYHEEHFIGSFIYKYTSGYNTGSAKKMYTHFNERKLYVV